MQKFKEAATLTDSISGETGAALRSHTEQMRCSALVRLDQMVPAAQAASSAPRSARACGSRTVLLRALLMCGNVAADAPGHMASAERESREQEALNGSASHGLDLSQEVSFHSFPK